jgi:hypothetical protein
MAFFETTRLNSGLSVAIRISEIAFLFPEP